MVRFFNIFRKKPARMDTLHAAAEIFPLQAWMKYSMDPFERYDRMLKSSIEGGCILELIHRFQDKWLVKNQEIEVAFDAFACRQQSNAAYIVQLYFFVLAQLGYYRTEIIPVLLIYPMRAFYSATGSAAYNELLQFINDNLVEYKIISYEGLPPTVQMDWFKDYLERHQPLIDELFQQLVQENKK
jgi:hypothetical protein